MRDHEHRRFGVTDFSRRPQQTPRCCPASRVSPAFPGRAFQAHRLSLVAWHADRRQEPHRNGQGRASRSDLRL